MALSKRVFGVRGFSPRQVFGAPGFSGRARSGYSRGISESKYATQGREKMIELVGSKELGRAFAEISLVSVRKIMRPAISKALTIANKEAKRLVPVRSKQLKRSIGKRVKTYKQHVNGQLYIRYGYNTTYNGKHIDPVKYAHLVEFGTRRTKPQSFMRAALGNKKAEIESTIRLVAGEKLELEAHKASMRGKRL